MYLVLVLYDIWGYHLDDDFETAHVVNDMNLSHLKDVNVMVYSVLENLLYFVLHANVHPQASVLWDVLVHYLESRRTLLGGMHELLASTESPMVIMLRC